MIVLGLLIGAWSSRVLSGSYSVGAGDLLEVKVLSEPEFSGEFRISTDGSIDYPHLRKIDVAGKTPEELVKILTEKLKTNYLVDPQVAVDVKEYRSQQVLVLGAVRTPGTYVLKESTRILDLLSRAGGITSDGGKRILLMRSGTGVGLAATDSKAELKKEEQNEPKVLSKVSDPLVIDYFRLVHKGDFSQNLEIQGGDVINIPKANEIFVLGNVARPGPVTFEENMTILQAVTSAGGPTATASPKSTYILRAGVEEGKIGVRLDRILQNKEKNFILQPDDVIVIPESFF